MACALALCLAAAPAADAYIYWANKYENQIGRARLDGSHPDEAFIQVATAGAPHPVGLAVDARHVYWANFEDADSIGRANLDGTGVDQSFVTGASDPVGVAVDGGHVYWTNRATNTIGRADLDGSHPDQSFITGANLPYGLAVDARHVYWTNLGDGTIGRADLDSGSPDQSFITGASGPTAVAVDPSHVYWVNPATNSIGRADLGGGNPTQTFITGAVDPWGLAVDGRHLYWTNQGPPKWVGRARIDGTGVNQTYARAADTGVYGVAAGPLVTRIGSGPAGTVASRGASFSFGSSEPAGFDCAIDGPAFKPCGSPASYSRLANGFHAFAVRARDGAGDVDPTPATRIWAVNVPTASPETHPPVLSALAVGRSRLRYSVSEAATVRIKVKRRGVGRRVGGKCRKRTRRNRARPKCDLKAAALRQPAHAGVNHVRLPKLRAGRYLLTAVATDAAGDRSTPASTRFKIRAR